MQANKIQNLMRESLFFSFIIFLAGFLLDGMTTFYFAYNFPQSFSSIEMNKFTVKFFEEYGSYGVFLMDPLTVLLTFSAVLVTSMLIYGKWKIKYSFILFFYIIGFMRIFAGANNLIYIFGS